MASPFPPLHDNPGYLLWQAHMAWQARTREALAPFDLTPTQFVVLAALSFLSESTDVVTQNDVAAHAGIDRMMTSKLCIRLEKMGWIERGAHPEDARARVLRVAAARREPLRSAVAAVLASDADFFAAVADREDLVGGLRALLRVDG